MNLTKKQLKKIIKEEILKENADAFEDAFGEHDTPSYWFDLAQAIVAEFESEGGRPDLSFEREIAVIKANPEILEQDPWTAGSLIYKKANLAEKKRGFGEGEPPKGELYKKRTVELDEYKAISYQDVRDPAEALTPAIVELLSVHSTNDVADALELLSNEVRDGMIQQVAEAEEGEEVEGEDPTDPAAAKKATAEKAKGMKAGVQRVVQYMFREKKLQPALEKIKGDKLMAAQLLALVADQLGLDPQELAASVAQIKKTMGKV